MEVPCGVAVELLTRPSLCASVPWDGPKHPEVHRVRLDHRIDTEVWVQNFNWVQCDVNFLSKDNNSFFGKDNERLFRQFHEKLVEAYR